MKGNLQNLRRKLEMRFDEKHASAVYKEVGEAMVRHCQRVARSKTTKGFASVWSRIAAKIHYRMTFAGPARRVVLIFGHPAAAMREFGGTIRAGGPYAETSPWPGVGIASFIPLGIRGTAGEGKQLGKQSAWKFGAAGGTSYSDTRLHSMPLARYRGSAVGSVAEKIDRFSALIGDSIKANVPARKREAAFKDFKGSTKLVFRKSSRNDIEPLYLLVKQCYIPPHPWIPKPAEMSAVIKSHFRSIG